MTDPLGTGEAAGEDAQRSFFRITDNIPEEAWYWAALGSIGLSAALRLSGHAHWRSSLASGHRRSSSSPCTTA